MKTPRRLCQGVHALRFGCCVTIGIVKLTDTLHIQIRVEFNPTVPHCSLATLIGLCIRVKIERSIPHQLKLDIYIKKGTHSTEDESKDGAMCMCRRRIAQ